MSAAGAQVNCSTGECVLSVGLATGLRMGVGRYPAGLGRRSIGTARVRTPCGTPEPEK